MRHRVDLTENGPAVEVVLSDRVGLALMATGLLDARSVPGTSLWSLTPLTKVGAIAVGDVEVHVAPKIPISRVVFLLEHSRAGITWRREHVETVQADDLLSAVVEVFERVASQALRQGLVQGYRTVEEALPVVRGRIREAEQLGRRFGLALPVEVRYDDFTPDTAENRLLRCAVSLSRRLPGLSKDLRHRLTRLDLQLGEVTLVHPRHGLEPWQASRLNGRIQPALRLADVIVRHCSFELPRGDLTVTGFIINMAKTFEDFLCAQLTSRLSARSGSVHTQDPWFLDQARAVKMAPDLVWYRDDGVPAAVVDAKYKAEKPAGFPDADLYQMLAYCTATGLTAGHLVYARGNEAGRVHQVANTDVTITAHALDLEQTIAHLRADLDELASCIARGAIS